MLFTHGRNMTSTCLPSGCQNVRNRNVIILAKSELRLQSISIGHSSSMAYGKPRVTNQVRIPSSSRLALCAHRRLCGAC